MQRGLGCPPSRGRATNAREKESSLAILRPEGRGPPSYPVLGVRGTTRCEPPQPMTGANRSPGPSRVVKNPKEPKDRLIYPEVIYSKYAGFRPSNRSLIDRPMRILIPDHLGI
ncbi:hypothetical protein CRG98_041386 [Punica granatum]|uniref:Uncharacterized protein n=1 Tax=Punica granatum TaxID=22663 RepID=A0A2I0I447_PUNGR|nr:hypothetical protein CRG98_041386 [Punica granatum]